MVEAFEGSAAPSEENPEGRAGPAPRRRWVYEITNHQVVGGLIVAVLLGVGGWLGGVFEGIAGYFDNETLPSQSYSGHLTFQRSMYKDIDAGTPTNASTKAGDVALHGNQFWLEGATGVKIAPYHGGGTPTAAKCDQDAQANGTSNLDMMGKQGHWVCIRSAKGSVAAFRLAEIRQLGSGDATLEGQAIIWRR